MGEKLFNADQIDAATFEANVDNAKQQLQDLGFGVLPAVLTPPEVNILRAGIVDAYGAINTGTGSPKASYGNRSMSIDGPHGSKMLDFHMFPAMKSKLLKAAMSDARMLQMASGLIGNVDIRTIANLAYWRLPGCQQAFAPHRDCGSPRIPASPYCINLMIAVDDQFEDSSPLHFVSGSHLDEGGLDDSFDSMLYWDGNEPHPMLIGHENDIVRITLQQGSVVVFDSRTIHFSYPNMSDQPRMVFSIILCAASVPGAEGPIFVDAAGKFGTQVFDPDTYPD